MTPPPTVPEQWKPLGRTYNTHYYLLSEEWSIVLPDKGLKDDGASARVNIDYQTAYARLLERRCCVIVVLDSLTSQDSEARRIYAAGMQPTLFYAVGADRHQPAGARDRQLLPRPDASRGADQAVRIGRRTRRPGS